MGLINDGSPFLSRAASDLGYRGREFRRATMEGELRFVFRGVVVDGRVPDSRRVRLQAASLVLPEHAMVADHSAAWIYGVETRPPAAMRDLRLMCVVPHGRHRVADSRVRVRQVVVPDSDVVDVEGVPVTSVQRTTSDLLRLNFRPYALAAGDAMVRTAVVSKEEAVEYVRLLGGVPYVQQARELAVMLNPDSESHGESWMNCRILDAGLPQPSLNHVVTLADGRVRRLDAAFVEQRVASEYDGRMHHSTARDRFHDSARRLEVSEQLYWKFVIATYERIFGTDPSFEEELGELLGLKVRPRRW